MAEGKISYRLKKATTCPACKIEFSREEVHKGGGRMNAGDMTDELHREYLPTQKIWRDISSYLSGNRMPGLLVCCITASFCQ